jgi:hypothetical protein
MDCAGFACAGADRIPISELGRLVRGTVLPGDLHLTARPFGGRTFVKREELAVIHSEL